jgi:anti-sigma regulatory factor (Ser/Thr protein kinase)
MVNQGSTSDVDLRVLLVDSDREQLNFIGRTLRSMARHIETRSGTSEIPELGYYDLVVANYDLLSDAQRARLLAHLEQPQPNTRVLFVSAGRCRDDFGPLFGRHVLTNLLAQNGQVNPTDLIVTVQKIIRGEIFGLEKYFIWGVRPTSFRVNRSSDKRRLLEAVEGYAQAMALPKRLVAQCRTIVDELLTNAIYNAPRDANGRERYAHCSRAEDIVLDHGEEIEVRFCSDGRRLGIAAIDPFGSLTREQLLDYLGRCFRKGEDQIDEKQGGAGLGLYYIFGAVSHLVANISPGRCTELIGLVNIHDSYRDFAMDGKSFNIFMVDR